jgi:hypothetical protein
MTRQELGWLRRQLLPLQQAGKLDVEEEFQQACFHITVYKSYLPPRPAHKPPPPAPPAPKAGRTKTALPKLEAPAGVPSRGQ